MGLDSNVNKYSADRNHHLGGRVQDQHKFNTFGVLQFDTSTQMGRNVMIPIT